MKKKVDPKINQLIKNCANLKQRGVFVILGDKGKDQIINLSHLILNKQNQTKPKILWCYKKELGFSSNQKKRQKEIEQLQKKGLLDVNNLNNFELFLTQYEFDYCYYKDTSRVLGNTYNILILQDFNALTPNILCKTIETVKGGGFVFLLFNTLTSLKQLHTISMDIHSRYRTENYNDVTPRFNERFIIFLQKLENCIVMDDELNITPINETVMGIKEQVAVQEDQQLINLKSEFKTANILGELINMAVTIDQVQVILKIYEVLQKKSTRDIISLTAGRGRGKSASIGMCISAAIQQGLSQIYVSAPNPSNLKTLFEFIILGLEALNYKKTQDFDVIYSTNEEFNKSIIRINIFKIYKQTIQFVLPEDADKIGNTDLLVIDEAASIPLVQIKSMIGNYPVFMSSTINGYEGTGRSLSLKLIDQLRRLNNTNSYAGKQLTELTMEAPIRYASNDPVEEWLNKLLLLEATNIPELQDSLPHPKDCSIYIVNRDTLFSGKASSEKFLFNLMSLFISSHYKNSPNDLQLLSDAPQHQVFVLMKTIDRSVKMKQIPDILCAVQVCFEGKLSANNIQNQEQNNIKPSGDMIPWVVAEQFQDNQFGKLSGARVIRIASHPKATKHGYGSQALQLLTSFFQEKLISLEDNTIIPFEDLQQSQNQPILKDLLDIQPPKLDYLGVSYGLTKDLFNFWSKNQFSAVYLKQMKNDITTEHTCIMLKQLNQSENWVVNFQNDFKNRFTTLLQNEFKNLFTPICLAMLKNQNPREDFQYILTKEQLNYFFSIYDFKRLESYSKDIAEYYLISDLLPLLVKLFFQGRFKDLSMSLIQQAILVGQGLQFKPIDQVSIELGVQPSQLLALFKKSIKKFKNYMQNIYHEEASEKVKQIKKVHSISIDQPQKLQKI